MVCLILLLNSNSNTRHYGASTLKFAAPQNKYIWFLLTDLREERSKLEKDLFTTDPVASSPSTKSIRFVRQSPSKSNSVVCYLAKFQ